MNDKHEEAILVLYRQSRTEQPSDLVDKRIRKAASRAHYRNKKRWLWSLSTAAVLVLSLTVVLKLFDGEHDSQEILWEDEPKQQVLKKKKITAPQRILAKPNARINNYPEILAPEEEDIAEISSVVAESQPQKRVKSPVRRFRKEEKTESMLMDYAESPVPVLLDNIDVTAEIPQLPVKLKQLIQLDESLSGEELDNGFIRLYSKNKLILTVSPNKDGFSFKALQGSEILGISVDWSLKAIMLKQCTELNMSTVCSLTDRVKAIFINKRLDHISWQVMRE